jgi:hypothetical protein
MTLHDFRSNAIWILYHVVNLNPKPPAYMYAQGVHRPARDPTFHGGFADIYMSTMAIPGQELVAEIAVKKLREIPRTLVPRLYKVGSHSVAAVVLLT